MSVGRRLLCCVLSVGVATTSAGCRTAAYDLLAPVDVSLVGGKEKLCLPPQSPMRWLWGVEGAEVRLEGQLVPLDEHDLAISAAGQEIRLSELDLADRPVLRIASGLVDADNRFRLSFSLPEIVAPGSGQAELSLGLELSRGSVIHEITAFIKPDYAHGADLLCAYFADEEGQMLQTASAGQDLALVARGYGRLPAGPEIDVVKLAPDARVFGLAYRAELPPMSSEVAATPWRVPESAAPESNLALEVFVADPDGLMLPLDGYFATSPSLLIAQ